MAEKLLLYPALLPDFLEFFKDGLLLLKKLDVSLYFEEFLLLLDGATLCDGILHRPHSIKRGRGFSETSSASSAPHRGRSSSEVPSHVVAKHTTLGH